MEIEMEEVSEVGSPSSEIKSDQVDDVFGDAIDTKLVENELDDAGSSSSECPIWDDMDSSVETDDESVAISEWESEIESDLKDDFMKNKKLWEAFKNHKENQFDQWLEIGANPELVIDESRNLSTFEMLCEEPEASEYISKCLEYKADPNKENSRDGLYPIHRAVLMLADQNIKVLLKADADCANQTIKHDKTPLHLLTEVIDEDNLQKVFEIIQIFSKHDGNFSWPARKSGNKTPFSLLLERLTQLKKTQISLKIIKILIGKYPKVDMFQRDTCARIIKTHFKELKKEYKTIKKRKEEIDGFANPEKLIVENEAEFLVMFDDRVKTKRRELDDYLHESGELLIDLTIRNDYFESFVAIYEMYQPHIDKVAETALSFNNSRVLKYILELDSVKVNPIWMTFILRKMKDKEIDINPSTLKCFHILLDNPKYDLNEKISDLKNNTALHFAATKSEYAIIEMLKRGASLGARNDNDKMAIQFIDSSALRKFLDTCITKCSSDANSDVNYYMVIDYSFLKASEEMSSIQYMTEAKDVQPLIEHPVISSFLFLKWFRLSSIFYVNLLLASINALSFIVYLMMFYVHQDAPPTRISNICFPILQTLAYASLIMFSAKELSQFISSPKNYLKSAENYFEIGFKGLMAVTLFVPLENHPQIRCSIAAVLYLGFAIEWTLILSELPLFSVSNYIVMLKKVALNFFRTLTFYAIILLAFAASFHTLTSNTNKSNENSTNTESNGPETESGESSMFSTVFHVILMLTGDFGEISEKVEESIIGRLFLLAFVLSMSIIMMNLLIGLTVSDTAAIESEAEWYKWWIRAKLLGKYEHMASNCFDWLGKRFLKLLHLMPDFLPNNQIKVAISSFESNKWIYIPSSTNEDDRRRVQSRFNFGCCKDRLHG